MKPDFVTYDASLFVEGSHRDLPSLRLVRLASVKVCIQSLSIVCYLLVKLFVLLRFWDK